MPQPIKSIYPFSKMVGFNQERGRFPLLLNSINHATSAQYKVLNEMIDGCVIKDEQQNKEMLNQKNSLLIKSSEQFYSNLFPHRGVDEVRHSRINFSSNYKRNSTCCYSSVCGMKKDWQNNGESKTVTIQFNNSAKKNYHQDVILRRKMLTTSQKFYNKKKRIVINYLKDKARQYQNELSEDHKYLKVATRKISKVDLHQSTHQQDNQIVKTKNIVFHPKIKKEVLTKKIKSFLQQSPSVIVFQKKQLMKTSSFFSSMPPSVRKKKRNTQALFQQKTEPILQDKSSTLSFQQFIPIRKSRVKKQPFVFGLSDKTTNNNPQKCKQKLVSYQDYLWKVNFSNALYVKIPDDNITYKAYIGPGNNSTLIKSILRRRFWWNTSDKVDNCQFVWTQLKINSIFKELQKPSKTAIDKLVLIQSQQICQAQLASNHHTKIFNKVDILNWYQHCLKNCKTQSLINQRTYKNRLYFFKSKQILKLQDSSQIIVHNHLHHNYYIGNKKALFYYMKSYYEISNKNVFEALPLTFHIVKGLNDPNYKIFLKHYNQYEQMKKKGIDNIMNVWIVKPGQNSNRGNGITVCHTLDDIKLRINGRQRNSDGHLRTFILQKYIQKPLLYKDRKFDIRHYMLITCINGIFKAYWYPQGYIRTSSSKFSLRKNSSPFIHLTNDAIQKYSEEYGKYEKGNKISYQNFQEYLTKINKEQKVFSSKILPEMKRLAVDAVRATYLCLDKQRRQHNFQLLGMDFMIDESMKPWLIEINTNPCLQTSSPLLAKIIPNLIQQTFKLCIDPLFPPPQQWQGNRKMYFTENPLQEMRYELIFDETVDGKEMKLLLDSVQIDKHMGKIDEDAQTFQNDGNFEELQ